MRARVYHSGMNTVSSKTIRTRFAPSPTGSLHVGGARTALFNWLFARHNGGAFILRIEDTDKIRSTQEAADGLITALTWFGLDWDEGPGKDGPYGPYIQSQRSDIYNRYIDRLLAEDKAYYAYDTDEELHAEKARQKAAGLPAVYSRRCAHLTDDERAAFEAEGRIAHVRFRMPDKIITVNDIVRGAVTYDTNRIGDFIIRKSDGSPSYNFAVVVDDYEMKISHIIRGVEHLSNTPRQIALYEAFGLTPPQYAHVSVILDESRQKLSKRDEAANMLLYMKEGFLPQALMNYLALLGWSSPDGEEFLSAQQLISHFDLHRCAKSDAVFDKEKFRHLAHMHMQAAPIADITDRTIEAYRIAGFNTMQHSREWLEMLVTATRGYCASIQDMPEYAQIFFAHEPIWKEWDSMMEYVSPEEAQKICNILRAEIEDSEPLTLHMIKPLLGAASRAAGVKGKAFYMTIRILLTGCTQGIELDYVLTLYGKEKALQVLDTAALRFSTG